VLSTEILTHLENCGQRVSLSRVPGKSQSVPGPKHCPTGPQDALGISRRVSLLSGHISRSFFALMEYVFKIHGFLLIISRLIQDSLPDSISQASLFDERERPFPLYGCLLIPQCGIHYPSCRVTPLPPFPVNAAELPLPSSLSPPSLSLSLTHNSELLSLEKVIPPL
jgi:hypothetical protein